MGGGGGQGAPQLSVTRAGDAWVASARALGGCRARGPTRSDCLPSCWTVALVEEEPPELVGVSEAAAILGWDRRKFAVYVARGHLPPPVAELAPGADLAARGHRRGGRPLEAAGGS